MSFIAGEKHNYDSFVSDIGEYLYIEGLEGIILGAHSCVSFVENYKC